MLNFIGILIERRKTYLILCISYVVKVIVEHFYALQKNIGAPLVQKGVAVGMLTKVISDELAIYMNLYRTYNEINEIRMKRMKQPVNRVPRRRARRDQHLFQDIKRRKRYHEKD